MLGVQARCANNLNLDNILADMMSYQMLDQMLDCLHKPSNYAYTFTFDLAGPWLIATLLS